MAKAAVILLHEIYGKNDFISYIETKLKEREFDVYTPDFLSGNVFSYSESDKAYKYYYANTQTSDNYVINMAFSLKMLYEEVIVMGFSAGATIAFKASPSPYISKTVCFYGSRIRDNLSIIPHNKTLLLLANQDSYDVDQFVTNLQGKPNLLLRRYPASHGFMDPFSSSYDEVSASEALDEAFSFLRG